MDVAIAIRTAVLKDGKLHVQAAAGIVADSDPQAEWRETQHKTRAILRAAEVACAAHSSCGGIMILMIDNFDSFTYNLVQYFGELGAEVKVVRNNALTVEDIERMAPGADRRLPRALHAERGRHLARGDPPLRRRDPDPRASASATRRSARRSAVKW